jgi:hypothetical protein
MIMVDTAGRASIAISTTAETKTVGIHDGSGANFATTRTGPVGTKVVSGVTATMIGEKADKGDCLLRANEYGAQQAPAYTFRAANSRAAQSRKTRTRADNCRLCGYRSDTGIAGGGQSLKTCNIDPLSRWLCT